MPDRRVSALEAVNHPSRETIQRRCFLLHPFEQLSGFEA